MQIIRKYIVIPLSKTCKKKICSYNKIMKLLALNWFEPIEDPYGQASNIDVIDTNNINDPLRDWAKVFSEGIEGIGNPDINWFTQAKDSLLQSIQISINRFLGFLALVAVIYLIIQGIQLLINPKDDEVKKIQTRIQNTARVLWWIWASWLFVSFIFRIVKQFIGA